jgi:hypothetical protein
VQNDSIDAAVIAIGESQFGGLLPPAIPLATRDYQVQPGQTLCSVGCAGGAWSTGWKGHALDYAGDDLRFVPAPASGRSGSALFDAEGERIVGVVRARTLDNGQGIAVSVQSLYGQLCRAAAERQVQCGPNGCTAPQYRLLPYRQQQQQQQPSQPKANPWPTMPPPPVVDLGPTNQRLDQLLAMLQAQQQAVPTLPPARGPDPLAQKALDTVEQVRSDVPKLIDERIKPLADKVDRIDGAVKPIEAIKGKLDTLAAKGGLLGKLAERVEGDLADPTTWVKHLVIGICVAAVIAFGVIHLLRTGRGFGADVLDKIAARHPDNQRLQDLASKVDGIEDRIAARLRLGVGTINPVLGEAVTASAALQQLLAKVDDLRTRASQEKSSAGTGAPS